MSLSAEFIAATVFAVIMVLISLGAIWIVRWQTYFLLRHQGEFMFSQGHILLCLFCLLFILHGHLSQTGHDPEYGPPPGDCIEAARESIELAAARLTSGNGGLRSGPAAVDRQGYAYLDCGQFGAGTRLGRRLLAGRAAAAGARRQEGVCWRRRRTSF